MNGGGCIRTVNGYVPCAGISLVYVTNRNGDHQVMVRTIAQLDDIAVFGMTSHDETEAFAYANEVAGVIWGAVFEWEE